MNFIMFIFVVSFTIKLFSMKNLTEFKKFLKSIEGNPEKKVVLTRETKTFYAPSHPGFQIHPAGHIKKEVLEPSYISIAQTNSFARKTEYGDSGLEFGSAKNWKFEGNTATYTETYGREGDHTTTTTLEYRFI